MRARDIDRVNARARIDAAYEEGQLGADEYEQRSERAQGARTLGELAGLVGDLQPGKVAVEVAAPTTSQAEVSRYPAGTRARDGDRSATCLLLDAGLADGQLSEADHHALTELAGEARTLGELADITADLQRAADAPGVAQPPRQAHRGRGFGIAVLAACAAVFAGGFIAVDRPPAIPAGAPVVLNGVVEPIVVPTPDLFTAEGISVFLDLYRAKFGDVLVDELTLYGKYASLTRAVPGQANRQVDYTYRGGFKSDREPTTRKQDLPVFDLGTVDLAALGRLLASAPTTLKVEQGTISHVMFETDAIAAARGLPGVPIVRIYVTNKASESGFLELTPAGVVTRTYPFGG
nr:DUF1707 domain-containing protein [Nocardia sp. SYP-A9097]